MEVPKTFQVCWKLPSGCNSTWVYPLFPTSGLNETILTYLGIPGWKSNTFPLTVARPKVSVCPAMEVSLSGSWVRMSLGSWEAGVSMSSN